MWPDVRFLGGDGVDLDFLTMNLTTQLRDLRLARRLADHEPAHRPGQDDVVHYLDVLLGIGRPGLVQTLLRIGMRTGALKQQSDKARYLSQWKP